MRWLRLWIVMCGIAIASAAHAACQEIAASPGIIGMSNMSGSDINTKNAALAAAVTNCQSQGCTTCSNSSLDCPPPTNNTTTCYSYCVPPGVSYVVNSNLSIAQSSAAGYCNGDEGGTPCPTMCSSSTSTDLGGDDCAMEPSGSRYVCFSTCLCEYDLGGLDFSQAPSGDLLMNVSDGSARLGDGGALTCDVFQPDEEMDTLALDETQPIGPQMNALWWQTFLACNTKNSCVCAYPSCYIGGVNGASCSTQCLPPARNVYSATGNTFAGFGGVGTGFSDVVSDAKAACTKSCQGTCEIPDDKSTCASTIVGNTVSGLNFLTTCYATCCDKNGGGGASCSIAAPSQRRRGLIFFFALPFLLLLIRRRRAAGGAR